MTPEHSLAEVKKAVGSGDCARAEALARAMPASWEKARALLDTAEASDRVALIEEAVVAMPADVADWKRADLLNEAAKAWVRAYRVDRARWAWNEAIRAAKQCESNPASPHRAEASSVLGRIAIDLARAGDPGRARDIAENIANGYIRSRTLAGLQQG